MDDESDDTPTRTEEVDVSDEEARERAQKRQSDDLTEDDIQTPQIREAVEKAKERRGDAPDGAETQAVSLSEPPVEGEPEPESDSRSDVMAEVEDHINRSNEAAAGDGEDDTDTVLGDVEDDEIAEMLESQGTASLNVVDDIDPEHFDYENQEFENFAAYGQRTTIEYKGAYFLLEQPDDATQQELLNELQQSSFADGQPQQMTREDLQAQMEKVSMGDMLDTLIAHTVTRPVSIEDMMQEWSTFDRFGLGLLCMEFLGLDALGNI